MPSQLERSLVPACLLCGALLFGLGACDATKATGSGGMGGDRGGNATGGAGGSTPACTFSTTYTITDGGGLAPTQKQALLSPPATFQYERQSFVTGTPTLSCTPALPACGAAPQIDVSDIEAAMANADVQAAFATAPTPAYGSRNVADGPFFGVERAPSGGFSVGIECTDSSPDCVQTPPGVHALVQLLHALITQQLADPACASVQN